SAPAYWSPGCNQISDTLPIPDVEDGDRVVLPGPAPAFCPGHGECHRVLVVSQDVVKLQAEGASGQLSLLRPAGQDLVLASMVAGEWPPAGEVEDNAVRQECCEGAEYWWCGGGSL